jgi:PAS domain S-box-containing protein
MVKNGEEKNSRLPENSNRVDGSVGKVFVLEQDIAEHKRAEEKLRECEHKFRTAFMTSLDAVYIATLEEGRIIEVNDEFQNIFGYARGEIIGKTSLELKFFYDPLDRARVVPELRAHGRIKDFEIRWRRKDGQIRTCCLSVSVVPMADEPHVLCVIRDITEQQKTEEELRKREEEIRKKSFELEDANAALKVLLRQRDEDKSALENAVHANVKNLVFPHIEKLKRTHLSDVQEAYVNTIESGLDQIVSPFLHKLGAVYSGFTRTEIQVADLIRSGKSSKEIAKVLNVSEGTVEGHRNNMRKKLGLRHKNINLQAHLLSL